MKIPKPTDADRERFRVAGARRPDVETKPMFGNLGAFVNGNMFMGLFGSDVGSSSTSPTAPSSPPSPVPGRSDRPNARWRLRHAPRRLDATQGQAVDREGATPPRPRSHRSSQSGRPRSERRRHRRDRHPASRRRRSRVCGRPVERARVVRQHRLGRVADRRRRSRPAPRSRSSPGSSAEGSSTPTRSSRSSRVSGW